MKQRISKFGLFLALLFCFGLNAHALEVTFEWDVPGSVAIQLDSSSGRYVDLSPDQTSYTLQSAGWCYIYGADGYVVTGAESTDGKFVLKPFTNSNGIVIGEFFGGTREGITYKVSVEKVERNDAFTVDVVNGLSYINAKFTSGYVLDLQEGSHTYYFNPDIDGDLTLSLSDVSGAYMVTLNGEEVNKNNFYSKYEGIDIKAGDALVIKVFEGAEPETYSFTLEYGEGMEGSLLNIYNRSSGNFIYPDDIVDNTINVKEGTELRVNLQGDDFTFSHLYLNGSDIISTLTNNSVTFFVDQNTTLKIEGAARVYGTVDITGYIINAEGVSLSYSYDGNPFAMPQGEAIGSDIWVTGGLVMTPADTKKYVISVSEKKPQFFFAPKQGYYISNLYVINDKGQVEQHAGNSSINANIDGTTFYMVVEKLPEVYTANLNIVGEEFFMRVKTGGVISNVWGNPAPPSISIEAGEQEISFLPGYGTPIIFGFTGDESMSPAVYLDGAEVTGVLNSESGSKEFSVTPYSPSTEEEAADVHSSILVYNSLQRRPQMSGASLQLENGAKGEFYYSPVMHVANPAGQPVISGTQFTVRPTTPNTVVMYKDEVVSLNENGEYVFTATGNARNNVVKLTVVDCAVEVTNKGGVNDNGLATDLSEIYLYFPDAVSGEISNESGARLSNSDLSYSKTGVITVDKTVEQGVRFTITFTPAPDEAGEYLLQVSEGTITIDGAIASPSVEETFVLDRTSGIADALAEGNGNVTVVTIDGKVVLDNAPASELRTIEDGLYIINGKKVLKK